MCSRILKIFLYGNRRLFVTSVSQETIQDMFVVFFLPDFFLPKFTGASVINSNLTRDFLFHKIS